jgi:flagellar motor switch protein FliN
MANSLIGLIANNSSKRVNILPRDIKLNDLSALGNESFAELTYMLEIEGKLKGKLWILFPVSLLKGLAALLGEQATPPPELPRAAVPITIEEPARKASTQEPVILAQPASFSQLPQLQEKTRAENLDLILDIPVSIKAVLGKVEISVRELIEMSPGKVLELDKLAGEPVDLVVNERLVAHGEIIVVDEKFGVKVMDVLSKAERIFNLK